MSDVIATLNAALDGRYAVEREIGAGGMATVYLARDLRHERRVALKVLKAELGAVLGVERFLSEIRVTANLQHPHLLPLFDSGEAQGLLFYVMPFVEGETLRHRLEREKQLPVEEALRITTAVAGALAYAHEHGVIHRDLKPENILLQAGQPVVSDFGIALAVTNAGGARVTQTGLSLGTPQYMSPEQASGDRQIDARSDVYSLAAMCYEMLVGEPPHTGATVQAIIARVLTDRPRAVRESRDTVPVHVEGALAKALAKLPADRFSTASQFAEALGNPASGGTGMATAAIAGAGGAPRAGWTRWVPWVLTATAVAIAGVSVVRRPTVAEPVATMADLQLPFLNADGVGGLIQIAVSRDGRRMAFQVQATSGMRKTYVRASDQTEFRELPGVASGGGLAFSPDGSSLALFSGGTLQRIALDDGGATAIATLPTGYGIAWDDDDRIIVATVEALLAVPAQGGAAPIRLAGIDTTRPAGTNLTGSLTNGYAAPTVLPNGAGYLVQRGTSRGDDIVLVTRDGTTRPIGLEGQRPRYVASGHLVVRRPDGVLMAYGFDPRTATVDAKGVPVVANSSAGLIGGVYDISRSGLLIVSRGIRNDMKLVEISRDGVAKNVQTQPQEFRLPRVSPDGKRFLVEVRSASSLGSDIALVDRRTGTLTPFTTGGGFSDAVWSPDGATVYFRRLTKARTGPDIWRQDVERTRPMEPVLMTAGMQYPWAVTPDKRSVLFDEVGPGVIRIKALTIGDSSSTRPVVSTEFPNYNAALSPDGKWLAFTSAEGGPQEVYVQPYPGPGGRVRISNGGGNAARWSRDGTELFYRDSTSVVAVRLRLGDAVEVVSRTPLFTDRFARANATNYDVLPGGGFLMLDPVKSDNTVTMIVNLGTFLRERLARAR